VLYLHTFGTPYLSDASGEPLTGAAAQRRLLALLAVLASAGSGGVSRDRIIGILWSESDTERARGALAQALYHIRRTLGCDDLVTGRDDLRLNREQIAVDAWEFAEAIAAGDFERVAAVYRGPFLDGFFLSGAPEFERWTDAQRARYQGELVAVLDRLATTAESRHDFAAAVNYLRRRAALDPLDTAGAMRLMTTLAAAGDVTGALQHARVHEVLLRDRLDVEPDPRVRQLVARFRTAADPPSTPQLAPDASVHAEVSVSKLDAAAEESEPSASPATVTMPVPPEPSRARRRHVWRLATVAVVVPLTIAAILAGNTARRMQGVALASMPAQPIIIAPFRVAGADPSLAYLREGMVELLSARLADDTSLRSVDPGIVLGGWRAAGLTTRDDAPRAEILRTAERLGASRVVVGSIVGTLPHLIVSASVIRISSGDVTAEATVRGSADSLAALVDRLAVALLAVEAGEHDRLARSMTPSLPALRAYLEGQTAYRRGDPSAAVQHYERALAADSTFALAALRLALAADRINDAEQHDRALALAWGARTELSDRDAAHLTAFAGPRYPAPSPATEQLAAWQHAASLMPDRAEVWYELGERYFHDGAVLGVRDAGTRARASLMRALELDRTHAPSRRLLVLLAARAGDTTELSAIASAIAIRDSMGDLAAFVRWRVATARSDRAAIQQVQAEMPTMSRPNLRAIALASQFDAIGIDAGTRAARLLRSGHSQRANDLIDALLAEHSLAVNAGRPVLALDVTEQLEDVQPGWRAHLRLRILDAIYADGAAGRVDHVEDAAEELSRLVGGGATSPAAEAIRLADACVVAQWRLSRGEVRGVAAIVGMLRSAQAPRIPVPIGANPLACAEIVDAKLAVATRQPDALQRVSRLDSLMLSGPAVGDAGTYAHIVIAQLYERLGHPDQALAAIRRRVYMAGWPRYLATARREEGRLALALGDRQRAMEVLGRYLALREDPEPGLRADVEAVRAEFLELARRR